jgi:ABC-2 type transport system permease protein
MTTLVKEATLTDRPKGTTLVGLLGVELRRLWWRRMTKVALLAVVVVTGVTVYTAYQMTNPEGLAQSLEAYEREVANFPQMVADCERAQQEARDAGQADADFGCAQMAAPTLENFGVANPIPSAIFTGLVRTNGLFYAFLAFVLGASFIAAEFSTGSLGTWLTFQPRRIRVGASKLAAAAGGGLLVGATGLGLAWLGSWMVGTLNRPDSDLRLPVLTDLGEPLSHLVLRHVGLVMAAGVIGAALGFLARNTGAVVGIVIGYVVVVEGILAQGVTGGKLTPWLPALNIEGFLNRGTTYVAERCTAGRCDYVQLTHTYTSSWVYLSVFGLVLSALALLVFRRRDVS